MTIGELLAAAEQLTREAGTDATNWDARVLLAHAVGGIGPLALDLKRELPEPTRRRFEALWAKRLSGAPVQHLVGEWDFFGRTFTVDARGLVPRPETELLIEIALRQAPYAREILDAGTGSGILAATLLLERREAAAVALDVSLEALALARVNRGRHGLEDRMRLLASDWLTGLGPHRFDLAVSNPPYLALSDRPSLSATVREHDPSVALFAGEDGLAAIRRLLDALPPHLRTGAPFLFEFGYGQAREVEDEIRRRPAWELVAIERDLAGIPRVAVTHRAAAV